MTIEEASEPDRQSAGWLPLFYLDTGKAVTMTADHHPKPWEVQTHPEEESLGFFDTEEEAIAFMEQQPFKPLGGYVVLDHKALER